MVGSWEFVAVRLEPTDYSQQSPANSLQPTADSKPSPFSVARIVAREHPHLFEPDRVRHPAAQEHRQECLCHCYSERRAFMGEMEAARLAGIRAATRLHRIRAMVATVRAGGSHQRTP